MTADIALVLSIVVGALVMFVAGILRIDLVALIILVVLALLGLVTPAQAIAGFSNPAVVTIAGMFVISAALARTGVASMLGRRIYDISGGSPKKLLTVMMLAAGLLSAFMNSVGLAAMMLPVVMDFARRTGTAPSKLLMPLVMGALLGGTTSLVGTAGNIVASDALRARGLEPFQVFDFTPVGLIILVSGVLFMVLVGWRLLPNSDTRGSHGQRGRPDLASSFDLQERLFTVRVPRTSVLAGQTLAASRLGSALGLHVLAIFRPGGSQLAPNPAAVLNAGDKLLVQGRPDLLRELQGNRHLRASPETNLADLLTSAEIGLAEVTVTQNSSLIGKTLSEANLRARLSVVVLALRRDGVPHRTALHDTPLRSGDTLLIQGEVARLEALQHSEGFENFARIQARAALEGYRLSDLFVPLQVTEGSLLAGRSLAEVRLGDAVGLAVIAIVRDGSTQLVPSPTEPIRVGDVLLVKARTEDLRVLRGLQRLEIEETGVPDLRQLESERVGLLEVILAPRSSLTGRTPRELHFREKYGLSLLSIWREGKALESNLRDVPLRLGDSLLLFGRRDKLRVLASEPDFIALTQSLQDEPRSGKAPLAVACLAAAMVPALAGWLPISIAVLLGATLTVLTGALKVEEAYAGVELPAIVLIAAMLPLGAALENTGAAQFLADSLLSTVGALGPRGVLAALAVMTAVASQAIPATALVVLMSPIAITAAQQSNISPHAVIMGVALSASSLSSPVGHPAHALIMGPGGYRYGDYVRVGFPLTLLILLIVVFVLPLFFPL